MTGAITILCLIVGYGLCATVPVGKEDRFVLVSDQPDVSVYQDRITGLCYANGVINGLVVCAETINPND